ncbi:MAG: transglycosylase domain-containing protein [Solirubrobacteraceae bacterium]
MSRRERQRRRRRAHGHPVRRKILLAFLLLFGGIGIAALAVVGWVTAVAASAPNLNQLKPHTPGQLSEIFAANGEPLGYIDSTTLRIPVSGSQIPKTVRRATVAIEDRRFWHHGALDYTGILRAAVRDLFGRGGLQGASTLTMQLIDNLYLKNVDHTLTYKIKQAKLAQQLYNRHSKNWILNSYLNVVPYGTVGGQTAYGVGAAARLFFDKPVRKLDLAQSALLAGMPQAPSEYNPFLYPKLARERRANVLQAMVQSHYITRSEAAGANAEPLQARHSTLFGVKRLPYVFDYVVQELHQRFCPSQPATKPCPEVDHSGVKVYTTIQPTAEAEAQRAILSHEGGPGQPAAALASIDPTNGHIVAIANSSSYAHSSFDYATQGQRQPGSAFKVFALMTLIHDYDGAPSKTFYNSHFLPAGWLPAAPKWSVHTAEETYQGTIDITKATIVSDNTVFAQLVVDLGMAKFDRTAHAMGITSQLNGNPAEVIGGLTYGVTPLEMADAYGTLANGGQHIAPTAIAKVVFPNGKVVQMGDPLRTRVFPYNQTYAATNVLKQVITNPSGTANATVSGYGCPAAGKTGTAENLSNAWFVGYTPRLSTAVWVGFPRGNIPIADGFGGALAGPIWTDFMIEARDGYCGDWAPPTTPWQGTAFTGPHSAPKPQPTTTGPAQIPAPLTNPQSLSAPPQSTPPATKPQPKPHSGPPTGGPAPTHGNGGGHGGGQGGGGGPGH